MADEYYAATITGLGVTANIPWPEADDIDEEVTWYDIYQRLVGA